jgi:hypothetical protein
MMRCAGEGKHDHKFPVLRYVKLCNVCVYQIHEQEGLAHHGDALEGQLGARVTEKGMLSGHPRCCDAAMVLCNAVLVCCVCPGVLCDAVLVLCDAALCCVML